MATLIHQTGTREAWTFKHDEFEEPLVIFPAATPGRYYVIREYGHNTISPIFVMDDREIFETYGFLVGGWDKQPPAK